MSYICAPFLLKATAVAASLFVLAGCSTIRPAAYENADWLKAGRDGLAQVRKEVPPVTQALTLEEAMARALTYNLDRRAKMMEEALAFKQLDVAHYDMLPKLAASAGYNWRNNEKLTTSNVSSAESVTQERIHNAGELGLTWSVLDMGVGYYSAQQQADRVLIAGEKRRKAMHLLMQDVRTAYWRSVSAQKLMGEVRDTIKSAEDALVDSRKTEIQRLRNPVDALRYQRQLLENLRLLEAIQQELLSARVELAALINVPLSQTITLVEPASSLASEALDIPLERLEEKAFMANADLREQHYNVRIAQLETRRTMVRLFPNLSFNYSANYDTDKYLVNSDWREAGVQLSFNLFNLVTGPEQMKLARAGVALADQRRMATQLAVMAQVHLARQQLANSVKQFQRADTIWDTDRRIADHMKNREAAATQSKLDMVANQTTAILSLLRRYQALAQAQAAEARLQATVGIEPAIDSLGNMTLTGLTEFLVKSKVGWNELQSPEKGGVKW